MGSNEGRKRWCSGRRVCRDLWRVDADQVCEEWGTRNATFYRPYVRIPEVWARFVRGRFVLMSFDESEKGWLVNLEEDRPKSCFEVGGQGDPPAPPPQGLEPFVPKEESHSPSSSCTDRPLLLPLPPEGVVVIEGRVGNWNPVGSRAFRGLSESGRRFPPSAFLRSAEACWACPKVNEEARLKTPFCLRNLSR